MTERRRPGTARSSSPTGLVRPLPTGARRTPPRRRPRRAGGWEFVATLAILGMLGLLTVVSFTNPKERTWVVLLVFPVLLALTAPLLARARRNETTFDLSSIVLLSLALGLALAYLRFRGAQDAHLYQVSGTALARQFLRFNFHIHTTRSIPGTGSVEYVSGLVNTITGSTYFATFLVFAFAAFLARYLFYQAFVTGVPEGDRKRYALLVFLWPSLLYWPSSMGKEACMLVALGVASLGAARLLRHQRGGLTLFVAGVIGAGMVRPHVALVPLAGMLVALLFRKNEQTEHTDSEPIGRLVMKVIGVIVILGIASVMARNASELLQTSDFGSGGVSGGFATTEAETGQGGSAFTPAPATNPLNYPLATVTVLFRPFPGEAPGVAGALAAIEGFVLFALVIASWKRIKQLPRLLMARPYLLYALVSTAVFIFAYSAVANFGILARQRTQIMPLLFVFLALPPADETEAGGRKLRGARPRARAVGRPRRRPTPDSGSKP